MKPANWLFRKETLPIFIRRGCRPANPADGREYGVMTFTTYHLIEDLKLIGALVAAVVLLLLVA